MIFYYKADDPLTRYYQNREFVCDGVRYSAGKATDSLFVSLGFTKVVSETRPDPDYFTVTGAPDNSGVYPKVERTLAEVKSSFCARQREVAIRLLQSTDYLVVEIAEARARGMTVTFPTALATFRDGIRDIYTANCAKIMAPTSTAALQTVMQLDYAADQVNALAPYTAIGEYASHSLGTYLEC